MKLDIHERFALLELLPKQGDYAGLKAIRKAREIIGFSQEEIEFYQLKRNKDNGQWAWDTVRASQRVLDAPLEEYVIDTVRILLRKMDEGKMMTELYMSLYEKFIINYRAVEL